MLNFRHVWKKYAQATVLEDLTLNVPAEKTTVLLGPSGCGKSTLLRVAAGLVRADSGEVVRAGEFGYVIQEGGLFPHLTAEENICIVPDHLGWTKARQNKRVAELATLTQLDRSVLARYPVELSGGQRQRVSLMRALVMDPPLLLLDEPLGALDPIIRRELQNELKEIFTRLRKTVLLVTHDLGEAAFLGDHILLMRAGKIVQAGSLQDFTDRPANPYVSEFVQAQRGIRS